MCLQTLHYRRPLFLAKRDKTIYNGFKVYDTYPENLPFLKSPYMDDMIEVNKWVTCDRRGWEWISGPTFLQFFSRPMYRTGFHIFETEEDAIAYFPSVVYSPYRKVFRCEYKWVTHRGEEVTGKGGVPVNIANSIRVLY